MLKELSGKALACLFYDFSMQPFDAPRNWLFYWLLKATSAPSCAATKPVGGLPIFAITDIVWLTTVWIPSITFFIISSIWGSQFAWACKNNRNKIYVSLYSSEIVIIWWFRFIYSYKTKYFPRNTQNIIRNRKLYAKLYVYFTNWEYFYSLIIVLLTTDSILTT